MSTERSEMEQVIVAELMPGAFEMLLQAEQTGVVAVLPRHDERQAAMEQLLELGLLEVVMRAEAALVCELTPEGRERLKRETELLRDREREAAGRVLIDLSKAEDAARKARAKADSEMMHAANAYRDAARVCVELQAKYDVAWLAMRLKSEGGALGEALQSEMVERIMGLYDLGKHDGFWKGLQ